MMIIPNKLVKGDTIGVTAPSGPIIGNKVFELLRAKQIVENTGFKVEFSKNIFSNTNGYSSSAKEKAQDINEMFMNKDIKMIWFAKGGNNSNTIFEYLDYELIKNNPKIICGYSDITSIANIIHEKTGLITFSGTNFKTIATDETDYSYKEALKRFVDASTELGRKEDKYITIKEGTAQGRLIGGNLNLFHDLILGEYKVNVKDKILFLEELSLESEPAMVSHYLAHMKQNNVFNQIKGLWIGNYEDESKISLEQIVLDTIGDEYNFPIIKSNNFGHCDKKTVIPIGIMAKIDTNETRKITLLENCVK